MKKNRLLVILSSCCMLSAMTVWAGETTESQTESQNGENFGVFTEIAGEEGTTYDNLFEVILSDEYDDYWIEKCASIIGEETAEVTAEQLKGSISADIYGQDAVDAYTAAPESLAFDCWYINDALNFRFEGDQVTTTTTDGNEQTHTYEYLGQYKVGEGETLTYNGEEMDPSFDCDVYKSTDDAGEFTYFFLRDDTMEKTYHIEFRYGSDLEELQGYFTGDYAYWLAAGIEQNADEDTVHDVIDLFVTENVVPS